MVQDDNDVFRTQGPGALREALERQTNGNGNGAGAQDTGENGNGSAQYDGADGAQETGGPAPDLFDDEGKFCPAYAGAALLREGPMLLGTDGQLWRYKSGVYRPDGDSWAKARLRALVGRYFRRNQLEEVAAYLRARVPTALGNDPPTDVINCASGLLDWRTGTLRTWSPDVRSINQIPVTWNPDATCPTILRYFAEVFPWDTFDLVCEICGYALYPGNPFRKAILLLGPGGNGKSTFLRLLTKLLGAANVSSVALQTLSENRFAAADLYGKLANICGDLDARAIEHTSLFKQVTGGDPIYAERKFKDGFAFVSYALPIFSANALPRVSDQTDAWFSRWLPILMPNAFPDEGTEARDAALAAELEGLFVLAVRGLQRLMARERLELPASVKAAQVEYRQTLDTAAGFLAEECRPDPNGWLDRAELYQAYRQWCQDSGRPFPLAKVEFNQRLRRNYPLGPRNGGRPSWIGLRRRMPWDDEDVPT
jgi:putative DNA primase/helicase